MSVEKISLMRVCGFDSIPEEAEALAKAYRLQIIESAPDGDVCYLQYDENGISMRYEKQSLLGDFTKFIHRIEGGKLQHELILKALKLKKDEKTRVLDMTAGMGEDAFFMAASGAEVTMIEHNPMVALLLKDAMKRGREHPQLAEILNRMTLLEGESADWMNRLDFSPDVVYLDPMYPEKRKNSASKNKPQMLQKLEQPCSNEEELFSLARNRNPRKIIVKRPPSAPYFCGKKPNHSIERKAVRFDVYMPNTTA